ncbi:MAG: DUF1905 domain-containing protein [Candidatus Eremiobacteraeota bacterium]|nr:DUF1905 domain-containing protein [Candidatus Eremiobacteraeota bacterium]
MAFHFSARLRGSEPHGAGYIEVPPSVMRSLQWGRCVRVLVTIDRSVDIPTTIMNVGWGPSFLVPRHTRVAAGLRLDSMVSVSVRRR